MEGAVSPCGAGKDFLWDSGHGWVLHEWLGLEKLPSRTIIKARELRWQWARHTRWPAVDDFFGRKVGWVDGLVFLEVLEYWLDLVGVGFIISPLPSFHWPGEEHEESDKFVRQIWEDLVADLEFLYMVWHRDYRSCSGVMVADIFTNNWEISISKNGGGRHW